MKNSKIYDEKTIQIAKSGSVDPSTGIDWNLPQNSEVVGSNYRPDGLPCSLGGFKDLTNYKRYLCRNVFGMAL